jgi:hypothetical protein
MPLELTGHSQMHAPAASIGFELRHEVFASPRPSSDRGTLQACHKLIDTAWACDGSRTADFDFCDFKRIKTVR